MVETTPGVERAMHSSASSASTAFALRLHEAMQVALDQEDISTVLRAALELGQEHAVGSALDKCIAEDGKEIEQLCRKNCLDFVETMDELSALREDSLGLKRTVEDHCDQILKRGQPQLKLMEELAQCCRSIKSYREARQALETGQTVLELLERAETGLHTHYNNNLNRKKMHKEQTSQAALAAAARRQRKTASTSEPKAEAQAQALDPTNPFCEFAASNEDGEKEKQKQAVLHDKSNPFLVLSEKDKEHNQSHPSATPAEATDAAGGGGGCGGHEEGNLVYDQTVGVNGSVGLDSNVCNAFHAYLDGHQKKYYEVLSCLDKVHRLLDDEQERSHEIMISPVGEHRGQSGSGAGAGVGAGAGYESERFLLKSKTMKNKNKKNKKQRNPMEGKGNDSGQDDFESKQCNVVSTSKRLAKFLSQQVQHVEEEMQQVIGEDFNEWLLEARTSAKQVAQRKMQQARRVMREAAQVGSQQQDMVRVIRENWGKPLKDILERVVDQRVKSLPNNNNPFEQATNPHVAAKADDSDDSDDSDDGTNPFSSPSTKKEEKKKKVKVKNAKEQERAIRESNNALSNLNFAALHRCRYLYGRLNRSEVFAEYYRKQRGLQLKSDLERRGGSGSGHSTFFDQISDAMERILGFLIIEDKVLHTTRDIITSEDIQAMWEEASRVILDRLEGWLEGRSGQNFLSEASSICSHVALFCTVVAHYGLDIENLRSFTERALETYGKTLQSECTQWIAAICKEDLSRKLPRAPKGKDLGEGEDQWYLDDGGMTEYSESLPEVVNLTLNLLHDSLIFIEGTQIGEDLTFPSSFFDNDSRQQITEIAHSIVKFCILPAMKDMIKDPHNDLSEATQLMSNIYFGLIPAFHGLDSFVEVLCSSRSLKEAVGRMRDVSLSACLLVLKSPDYVAKGASSKGKEKILPRDVLDMLYEVMDLSEENVLEILCAKVDSYSANYIMMDWCPSTFPTLASDAIDAAAVASSPSPTSRGGGSIMPEDLKESECVQEIVSFIEKISKDSKKCMPPYLHGHLFSQVFKHAADHILRLLSCSAVSKFNLISIMQLKADMKFLKRVAVKILEDDDVDLLFAGLVQVLDYLLSCLPESILDSKVRSSLYPMINTQMLGRLLYKYTETEMKDGSNNNNNNSQRVMSSQAPTKAAMEAVAQKLLASV